jgi:predicted RNA-binding protein
MRYWIIALPRADMEHCIRIRTFGLKRKFLLGNVSPGDKVACYTTGERKVIALGEVTAPYYVDDTKIFKADAVFPDRFDFMAKPLAKEAEIDLMPLVEKLSFIKSPAHWSVYLRVGIAEMSEKDWKVFEELLLR